MTAADSDERSVLPAFVADRSDLLEEVVKFAITGGSGLVANLALLYVLVETGTIPERYAAIVSTLTVLLGSFALTNWWVFTDADASNSQSGLLKRGLSYYGIMGVGKLVNYGIYLGLLAVDVWYPLAWFVGSALVFFGTFSMNRLLWYRTD
ncbi:GtrA family protein [Halosimplex sp. TS25]|uniref:GtrA family protein n=1 Tax=Halosimplex rarum TaxID=3396619 RepID=UPI0039EB4BB8